MSGRGKGGKGLGKGGAKRHRKVLRDNIQVRSTTCCTSFASVAAASVYGCVGMAAALLSCADVCLHLVVAS